MRAHYFQHVAFEGLGTIDAWLNHKGYQTTSTQFFQQTASLPTVEEIDFLIIMGGPMSVNDELIYPWLVEEKQFIRQFIAQGKPVLGICLGAQLIANAMGARVYPNREKEIGWFPVQAMPVDHSSCFQFPEQFQAFHWHGETFDLPDHAIHLLKSNACENQAFQLGNHVIGLQFHLEMPKEAIQTIINHCSDEMEISDYVQTEQQMLTVPLAYYHHATQSMNAMLDYLHQSMRS